MERLTKKELCKWHKTEKKEEIDFSQENETIKDAFKENQENFIKELYEKSEKVKEEMVIDDIIMIFTLFYPDYETYFKQKEEMIEDIRKAKQTPMYYGCKCGFTYYVEPIILSEETFNYIIEKRGIKKNDIKK